MSITEPDSIAVSEVLVVDDTIGSLQLLTDILSGAGFKVRPANDGELALRSVKAKLPDLILLDIKMPGMDGFEVCRHLKMHAGTRTIPVIFISALEDEHSKIQGFEFGAVDYISKPFHAEEVLARVKTHLTLNRLQLNLERQNALLLKEISHRKQAEQALEQLNTELEDRIRKRTAALAEIHTLHNDTQHLSKIGGWQWDIRNQTMTWTEETYRIHDLDPDELGPGSPELIDRSLTCYEPADRQVILDAFWKCAEQGVPYDLEFPFTSTSGRRLNVRTMAHALTDGDRIIKVIGNILDITDRKRAEAEKAELESRNRQLLKAKSLGLMAGAIAHNFNNYLQVVTGNLEMAMDDLPPGSDILQTLTEALKAARKAAEVSSLMLTYQGQAHGELAPMDLPEACRQSLALLQAAAPKGIFLKTEFPASGPVVHSNAGQIHQVLTHLVTNAWEAAGDNPGDIHLSLKTVSPADIAVSNRFPIDWQPQENVYACLEVADAGRGIPVSDIEKLFDPFFTTKFTGRGLGLPVVIGIVRAHDGGVTIESHPGQGSVFRVFLPVSAQAVPIPPGKTGKCPEIETRGTVLVVEDEEQVRNMVSIMLTRLGFVVLEARDGIAALEVFRQHPDEICCVICDLTMPRMNGWETLSALRSLSPGVPVVLSSGYDMERVMAGDHAELPQAFLGKPYQLKELHETICRVLANK